MSYKETIDDTFLKDSIAAYDAAAKELLSRKIFLSRILKRCVYEFKDCSPEDISEKYIKGEIEVSKIPVAPNRTNAVKKIVGDNVEYKTITEGETTFDIRFTAYAPNTGELIKLIINIEAQRKTRPGYSLIKRGIFHGSRLMSSQYNVEFTEPDFDDIKKVISIWICMSSPEVNESGITEYKFSENTLIGNITQKRFDYDLMQVVMVYIGRDVSLIEDELLKLLHLVFKEKLNAEQKKERLRKEYNIELDNKALEGVNIMCNLGEGLVEETWEEAWGEAWEEASKETMSKVVNNMLKENIPPEIISKVTNLPIEDIVSAKI